MRYVFGLVLTAALALGTPSDAKAQFSLSVGNPYTGQGLSMGSNLSPYGYGYGPGLGYSGYGPGLGYSGYGPGLGYTSYSRGYYGLGAAVAPGVAAYSRGYYGAPAVFGATVPVYPSYGYRNYGYGFRRPGLFRSPARRYYRW